MPPSFRRALVKISGEALAGGGVSSFCVPTLQQTCAELIAARDSGVETAVIVGGGNIFRGARHEGITLERTTADSMGMLATVINGLMLGACIEEQGRQASVFSALYMPAIAPFYTPLEARRRLAEGHVVIVTGGTSQPFFTTDTGGVLRAAELSCDIFLKATAVDGVYSSDPTLGAATRYDHLTYDEALQRNLAVMDATAFALAREEKLTTVVFRLRDAGALRAILFGEKRGSFITAD